MRASVRYTGRVAGSRWLFAYGSLIWRPDFPFERRIPARLHGWVRRFWQGSVDHRGVPGAPGRVVTLCPREGGSCAGEVYRIAADQAGAVLARLDHREKGGYARLALPVELCDGTTLESVLVYVATPDNPNYLGPAAIERIAEQVAYARGPSGANSQYVLELASALRRLGEQDPHVFELERQVLSLLVGRRELADV